MHTKLIVFAVGAAVGYFWAGKLAASNTMLAQVYSFGSGLHS